MDEKDERLRFVMSIAPAPVQQDQEYLRALEKAEKAVLPGEPRGKGDPVAKPKPGPADPPRDPPASPSLRQTPPPPEVRPLLSRKPPEEPRAHWWTRLLRCAACVAAGVGSVVSLAPVRAPLKFTPIPDDEDVLEGDWEVVVQDLDEASAQGSVVAPPWPVEPLPAVG